MRQDDMADEWDALEQALGPATASQPAPLTGTLDLLAADYERLSLEVTQLTEKLKSVAENIAQELRLDPDAVAESREANLSFGRVKAERGERWEWDQDVLKGIVGDTDDPIVQKRLTIQRRKFEALPASEQATYLPALTRKAGPLKITIER